MSAIHLTQISSITLSLLASGALLTTSLIDIPILKAQPADRALPSIRWYFSRGSHIFPQVAAVASAGFAYLAYGTLLPLLSAIPTNNKNSATSQVIGNVVWQAVTAGGETSGYLLAAVAAISIAPFTTFVMIPTNFELIARNADLGGNRSANAAAAAATAVTGGRDKDKKSKKAQSAEESTEGKGEGGVSQWTDLSGPAEKTREASSAEDDERVRVLLDRFGNLNLVRAAVMGIAGVVGLVTALA